MTIESTAAPGAAAASPSSAKGIVVASLVPDNRRPAFLPKHFGERRFLKGESAVYNWMGALCPDYRGGYWEFLELSNGGFYMRPTDCSPRARPREALEPPVNRMLVRVGGNGFEGDVSADAAGIIATLYALNSLACAGAEELGDAFYALREFAFGHPEGKSILWAID